MAFLPYPNFQMLYSSDKKCEVCGQLFTSPGTYTAARAQVYFARACVQCTFSMVHSFLDQTTSDAESQEQGDRECEDCNTKFKSRKGLMQHIGKMHTAGRKPATCPECNKKFKHKYAVRFHRRQVHDRATRVACGECGKEYYNKYMLKSHRDAEHT